MAGIRRRYSSFSSLIRYPIILVVAALTGPVAGLILPDRALAVCTLGGNTVTCEGVDANGYQETVDANRDVIVTQTGNVQDVIGINVTAGDDNSLTLQMLTLGLASAQVSSTTSNAIDFTAGTDGTITVSTAAGTLVTTSTVNGEDGFLLNISANTTGAGSIEVDSSSTVNATLDGIDATSGTGGIDINLLGGSITAGANGLLLDGPGDITVTTAASAGISAGDDGINAVTTGTGNITINTNGTVAGGTDAGDDGIFAQTAGGNITGSTNGAVSGDPGIVMSVAGNGSIDFDVNADVSGDGGDAINLTSVNGNITFDVGIASDLTAVANEGLEATTNGTGDMVLNLNGDIGVIGGAAGASKGVFAKANAAGDGDINIDTGVFSDIHVTAEGIVAQVNHANGTGDIDIDVLGDIEAFTGVLAQHAAGAGNVSVSTGLFSVIQTTAGAGINASTTGNGNVALDLSGDVDSSSGTEVVVQTNTGTATINNFLTGDINQNGAANDLVITATGGSAIVNNFGEILGRFTLSGSNDTVNNHSEFTWQFTGATDFGAGNADTINNDGQILTVGLTAATNDVTEINGLESFVNGTIDGAGVLSMRDNFAADSTAINPTAGQTLVFDGTIFGSTLAVDTFIDDDDPTFSVSDVLHLGNDNNAIVNGTTAVSLNDVSTSQFGVFDPNGIAVIDVDGSTGLGDFFLTGGPIDKGLFTYDLFLDSGNTANNSECGVGNNCWVLASFPDANALSLAGMVSANTSIWQMSSGDLFADRGNYFQNLTGSTPLAYVEPEEQGDGPGPYEENTYVAPPQMAPAPTTSIWGRFIGGNLSRTNSQTFELFPDQPVTVQGNYTQKLHGFQAGIDHTFFAGSWTAVAGVLAGYVESPVSFDSGDSATFKGPSIGAYARFTNGPWRVDGLLMGHFLTADYNVAGATGSTKARSVGIEIEAGYRFDLANNMYVEPLAGVQLVHSKIDPVEINGTPVTFNDGKSGRVKVGAKAGGSWMMGGGIKVEPYVMAAVGHEFHGSNTVFLDSGPGITVNDNLGGIFGEVGAGVTLAGQGGWSAFLNGKYTVGQGYHAGVARVGARFAF